MENMRYISSLLNVCTRKAKQTKELLESYPDFKYLHFDKNVLEHGHGF